MSPKISWCRTHFNFLFGAFPVPSPQAPLAGFQGTGWAGLGVTSLRPRLSETVFCSYFGFQTTRNFSLGLRVSLASALYWNISFEQLEVTGFESQTDSEAPALMVGGGGRRVAAAALLGRLGAHTSNTSRPCPGVADSPAGVFCRPSRMSRAAVLAGLCVRALVLWSKCRETGSSRSRRPGGAKVLWTGSLWGLSLKGRWQRSCPACLSPIEGVSGPSRLGRLRGCRSG